MAKLHHMTLKAAVEKYAPLHAEGKSEEEVKASIAEDEKGFDTDEVEQVYAAIIGSDSQGEEGGNGDQGDDKKDTAKAKGTYTVKSEFRDISDFSKVHKVGADVSHFDVKRLETLVANGLVEKK